MGIILLLLRISGPYHRGIDKRIDLVGGHEQFGVPEFHPDDIGGQDIGHAHLEHVGPLLLQERCTLARLFGLIILTPCILALGNMGGNGPLADLHLHPVDSGPGGCREDVYGFQWPLAFILVDLGHQHISNDTRDIHFYRRRFQGKLIQFWIITLHKKIGR